MIVIMALAIYVIVDAVHNFAISEPIGYFSEQPLRMLLLACIAIGGGFAAFGFNQLSVKLRRRIKLYTFGSMGIALLMFAIYSLFEFVVSTLDRTPLNIRREFLLIALRLVPFILLLALQFYQVFKTRTE